jgi:hypothetical protein
MFDRGTTYKAYAVTKVQKGPCEHPAVKVAKITSHSREMTIQQIMVAKVSEEIPMTIPQAYCKKLYKNIHSLIYRMV